MIDFASINDYPHKIKCEKCGRMFWTASNTNYGMCENCDPGWSCEITLELAKKIKKLVGLNGDYFED